MVSHFYPTGSVFVRSRAVLGTCTIQSGLQEIGTIKAFKYYICNLNRFDSRSHLLQLGLVRLEELKAYAYQGVIFNLG